MPRRYELKPETGRASIVRHDRYRNGQPLLMLHDLKLIDMLDSRLIDSSEVPYDNQWQRVFAGELDWANLFC